MLNVFYGFRGPQLKVAPVGMTGFERFFELRHIEVNANILLFDKFFKLIH